MRKVIDPANYYGKLRAMSFEVNFWGNGSPGTIIVDAFRKDDEDSMSLAIGVHETAVTIEEMIAIRDAISLVIASRVERDRAGDLTIGDEEI
jgi:hypothetical protein